MENYDLIKEALKTKKYVSGLQLEFLTGIKFKNISQIVKRTQSDGIYEVLNVKGKGYILVDNLSEIQQYEIKRQLEIQRINALTNLKSYNGFLSELNKTKKMEL